MNKSIKIALDLIFTVLFLIIVIIGGIFTYWVLRPNTAQVESDLNMETWDVETEYDHNAFTDMVYWNGNFYLSFRVAPSHADPSAKILVLKSTDAKEWQPSKEFFREGRDIRDPKMAIINDRLFIYVISALSIDDPTTSTFYSFTEDGSAWQDLVEAEPVNKRWWRPKTFDGNTWYCPIFRDQLVDLYKTTDGINWDYVSTIREGPGSDETDFTFTPEGQIVASMRIQSDSINGDNDRATLLCISDAPYTEWTYISSEYNRLDGPCLLTISDDLYAIGRFQPEVDGLFNQVGSALSRKRTALFVINDNTLIHLSDLPSAGDTSYPAAVVVGDYLYVSYYTNPYSNDLPWFLGMISNAKVRMARIRLSDLEILTSENISSYKSENSTQVSLPWLDYVVFIALISLSGYVVLKTIKKSLKLSKID